MYFMPNCFLIGAQKAGTTTLASLLAGQPDICVSNPKEPMFFSKNYSKGIDWYRTKFEHKDRKILLDASPDYSRTPTQLFPDDGSFSGDIFAEVPKRIYECNPDAKFIYILRDPVGRCYSSYWHYVRAGHAMNNSFSNAVRSSNRFLVASDYLGQIRNYLKYFQIEQFYFLLFEEFVKDPKSHLQRCCDFLGVDYSASVQTEEHVHSNRSYRLNLVGSLIHKISGSPQNAKRLSLIMKQVLPSSVVDKLRQYGTNPIPKIKKEDAEFLYSMFSESYNELEHVTGLGLEKWRVHEHVD